MHKRMLCRRKTDMERRGFGRGFWVRGKNLQFNNCGDERVELRNRVGFVCMCFISVCALFVEAPSDIVELFLGHFFLRLCQLESYSYLFV